MAQQVRASNPNVRHEQLLQHLNANQHRLDPQSQQQLQGINRAFQRERFGLGPEPQKGYPETLQRGDTYRPGEGGYIGPQQRAPVTGGERQAAGMPSGSTAPKGGQTARPAGRTSQGQQVRVGDRAINPSTGQVVQYTKQGWQPVQSQQSQQPQQAQRGGGRGKQSKRDNPFSRAAKALKPRSVPRLRIRPMRPIAGFTRTEVTDFEIARGGGARS
jgi:hypothetical protein